MTKRSVKSPGLISERVQRGNANHPRPEPILAALHTSGDVASCSRVQKQGQSKLWPQIFYLLLMSKCSTKNSSSKAMNFSYFKISDTKFAITTCFPVNSNFYCLKDGST